MELRELIEECQERIAAATEHHGEERAVEAKMELERMTALITNELKPPEKPAEKTDQAQKQDGVASS